MKADLAQLHEIFEDMFKDGFDVKIPLKWSFYFVDSEKVKLQSLYKELEDHDYFLERLSQDTDHQWNLKVSKIDSLTPEKLHKRNVAFNELADYFDVELYDGWDVEKVVV